MARLWAVLFIAIIPSVIGLSLVKLNERQKVGLPMFAYSKLNISDLNSVAEKFKQFFADVKESLDEYVETFTASGDGDQLQEGTDERKEKPEVEDKNKIDESWKDQLKDLESKKEELKKVVTEKAKDVKKSENSKEEIKEISKAKEDKPQKPKLESKNNVEIKKIDLKEDSDETTALNGVQDNKNVNNEIAPKKTKVILKEKASSKENSIKEQETKKVEVENQKVEPGKREEVKKPVPKSVPVSADVKTNKVPSAPDKVEATKKEVKKGDLGLTEEL